MTTHTPGPWIVAGSLRDGSRRINGRDGMALATALDFNAYARDAEADANARLIAQAPAMLANEELGILLAEAFLASHDKRERPCACILCHDARVWLDGTRAILRAVEG